MMPDTTTIRVRFLRAGDAERVAVLCTQLGYPTSAKDVKRRLESGRVPHYSSDQAVFVAESGGGQLMGWVQVCVRTILVADRHAEVEGLVVDENWRGKGVGHALMKRAEAWARQEGCRVVSLRSNIVREDARPFYEGIGYKVVKTQWALRKIL